MQTNGGTRSDSLRPWIQPWLGCVAKLELGAQGHEAGDDEDEREDAPLHYVHCHHEPIGRFPTGAEVRTDEIANGLKHARSTFAYHTNSLKFWRPIVTIKRNQGILPRTHPQV